MAIGTPVHLASGTSTGSPVTSAAFTPPANVPLYVLIVQKSDTVQLAGGSTPTDTIGDQTWVAAGPNLGSPASGFPCCRARVYRRPGVASPVSMTVSQVLATAPEAASISIFYVPGSDYPVTNTVAGSNVNGDPTASLSVAPAASSTVIACFGGRGAQAAPAPTNYTQLYSDVVGSHHRFALFYDNGSAATGATFSTTNTNSILALLEFVETPGATTVTLDTGTVAVAGADLVVAADATLDTGAVTVAGAEISPLLSITVDAGAIAAVGADLSAATSVLLDTGAIAVSGTNITPLAAGAVLLESGAVTVAGNNVNILAPFALALDTGAIAVAGANVLAGVDLVLDSGAIAAAGADLDPNLAVLLDAGAIAATGEDLAAAVVAMLDAGTIAIVGTELEPGTSIALEEGAIDGIAGFDVTPLGQGEYLLDIGTIDVAGDDLSANVVVLLDSGLVTLSGNDINVHEVSLIHLTGRPETTLLRGKYGNGSLRGSSDAIALRGQR